MALTCNLTKDLLKSNTCSYTLPEVADIYITNFDNVEEAPVDYDCTSSVTISGITLATGTTFYHIEPAKNSATFTDELVVQDNGNKYRTHTLTFSINGKYDKDMVCSIDALSLGKFFAVVVTADGEWLALGRSVGLEASAQSIAGGNDSNGTTITLTANVAESVVPLSEAAINKVKGV